MTRTTLRVLLVAGMVLLVGCAGGISGTPTPGDGDATDPGGGSTAVAGAGSTVTFYVSDQPNAIGDFEHLNVTITKVGFQQAGDGDEADDEDEADAEETAQTEKETETSETETPEAETDSPAAEPDASETEPGAAAAAEETESDGEGEEVDDGDDATESGGWVEFAVDDRTVDLTELQGDRATQIDQYDVPNGTYNKVFVYVSDIHATLSTGEQVNVKLPSSKLQINERFAVGNGSNVDFVFDIAVHKAGNSGKYILKPVISESGTDVPIEDVDAERGADDGKSEEDEQDDDEQDDDEQDDDEQDDDEQGDDDQDERESDEDQREDESASTLNATFIGNVSAGENATLEVTSDGDAVAGAAVWANGERVGTTVADGTLTFAVPESDELEVRVERSDAEVELEVALS